MTPEARQRMLALMTAEANPDEPEELTPWARCITGFNAGPPILPSAYNNNVLVVQRRDTVALLTEMVHEVRIVPLDGRPPLPSHVRQWQGNSHGRWEGDTLVIDTTNFRMEGNGNLPLLGVGGVGGQPRSGVLIDENLHVVERLSRPDADTLRYEVRVDDPTVWTSPGRRSCSCGEVTRASTSTPATKVTMGWRTSSPARVATSEANPPPVMGNGELQRVL